MSVTPIERRHASRRHGTVSDIEYALARVYRSFVSWGSMYGDGDLRDEGERRREQTLSVLGELSRCYFPGSLWLGRETRRSIESFIEKSGSLYSGFCGEIDGQGYQRARPGMSRRVSRELGPLRKEAESALEMEMEGSRRSGWLRFLGRSRASTR